MRLHGIGPREPWSYGEQAEAAVNAALALRARLLPYLERCLDEAHDSGLPVQRAMVLACPDEPAAWAFENQFFLGRDLLVAPCLEPGGRVMAYLPQGDWKRFPDGPVLAGGRCHALSLGLAEIAVFHRDGPAPA
jgi:alpha-D-xyloside xylohydrolase